jgi:acyl-coenzyme A thioesterase PaaI-like protein
MNLKPHLLKLWNFWPPFLFTGIKIVTHSSDFKYLKAKLKLRFWNANYVGTQFGGSMFSLADPFYMVMLMKNLGKGYIVWDKSASIKFLKPGKTDLTAEFWLTEEDLAHIKKEVAEKEKTDWIKSVEIKDADGSVVAAVEKTITIKRSFNKGFSS